MKYGISLLLILFFLSYSSEWEIKDSLDMKLLIPAGKRWILEVDSERGKLEVIEDPVKNLTPKAIKAISSSPLWLSIPLKDKFRKLPPEQQDKYAEIILNEKYPYRDEVAFSVAYVSEEILTDANFYPQLIVENAHILYANDSVLDYVDIIDSVNVNEGDNYFSTLSYRVEENGKITQYILPKDIYYWYVVHPRLQHEFPSYINPSTGNVAAPPTGKFWRSYIFNYKEESKYPSLREELVGVKTLWNCKKNSMEGNGALGVVGLWCNKIQEWGNTPSRRLPQPVWLYHQHAGTCSEHGWFANAAGRCALIPMTLNEAARFDHKWNMFYERGWKDFEPINGWINRMANDYWEDASKFLNGCFMWRGDGFIWGNTEQFTPVCTLKVKVEDSKSKPVDGAFVIVDCSGRPGPFCLVGWTNYKGIVSFLLGDNIEYFSCAIQSSIGNVSAKNVISNSKVGMSVLYSPKLTAALPQLKTKETEFSFNDTFCLQKIKYDIQIEGEIIYGKHNYSFDGYSFPSTFSEKQQEGVADFLVFDEDNFLKYKEGKEAEALFFHKDTSKRDGEIPLKDKKLYIVISNEERNVASSIAYVNFRLCSKTNSSISDRKGLQKSKDKTVSFVNGKEVFFLLPSTYKSEVKLEIFQINGTLIYKNTQILIDRQRRIFFKWNYSKSHSGVYFWRILDKKGERIDTGYFTISSTIVLTHL